MRSDAIEDNRRIITLRSELARAHEHIEELQDALRSSGKVWGAILSESAALRADNKKLRRQNEALQNLASGLPLDLATMLREFQSLHGFAARLGQQINDAHREILDIIHLEEEEPAQEEDALARIRAMIAAQINAFEDAEKSNGDEADF
jgi:chromosome segregation ATPase